MKIQLLGGYYNNLGKNDGAWNQNGTHEFGEEWEDSSSILKVELESLIELDGLNSGLDKKKAMKDGAHVLN